MTQRLDFRSLTTPKTPNWFLAAPEGVCRNAKPHVTSPQFTKTHGQIWDLLLAAVSAEPRITVHDQDKTSGYLDFTQVSALFRFPDRVTVQILDAGDGRTTLAVYSRSKYGRSDLSVNAKRVTRLLAALGRS